MTLLSPQQIDETADAICRWQSPSGMIPWFPGGHADPWNHIEAAMALGVAGRIREAENAFDWLVRLQRPDGSWFQYYDDSGVEQEKFDANVIAYVAAGVWHHYLLTDDSGFLDAMFPVVDRALSFVFELQQPRGEILWARHADGTPWSFALLTGSSSMYHSTRAGLASARELGLDREHWVDPIARLGDVVRRQPDGAFAPKNRWAMDWYYPVLCGAMGGSEGRDRLSARRDAFVMEGLGVRCVSDRPWVTTAETSECAIAHLAAGESTIAHSLFDTTHAQRCDDGHYWTGEVHPEQVHFPAEERSTYSASAVLLADDALSGRSAASHLFVDHDLLPV